jgi:hypothetical protein
LKAIEAAMRRLATAPPKENEYMRDQLHPVARDLPITSWFRRSTASPQFWSGAESDELVQQVSSLLRTCFKVDSQDPAKTSLQQEFDVLRFGYVFPELQILAHLACVAAGRGNISSTSSRCGSSNMGNSAGSSASSSSSSSRTVQLSSYTEPCPQPLLRIASLLLILFGQDSAAVLQPAYKNTSGWSLLAYSLFNCLEHVHWLGPQLQQLLLPGDPRKAAAALQGLQEQQQQLQQALEAALWRLNRAAALAANGQPDEAMQRQQLLGGSSSSSSTTLQEHETATANLRAKLNDLASSRPDGPISLADLDPARLQAGNLGISKKAAAVLVGAELPQQLQQFGSALWSALPQPRCCNNAACANLGSISEAKLVAGRASRCSKCKAAK